MMNKFLGHLVYAFPELLLVSPLQLFWLSAVIPVTGFLSFAALNQ